MTTKLVLINTVDMSIRSYSGTTLVFKGFITIDPETTKEGLLELIEDIRLNQT